MQKLTLGRIVHYRRGKDWYAAICVAEPEGNVAQLYVFPKAGWPGAAVSIDVRDVDDGHGANNDTWRWPPRAA